MAASQRGVPARGLRAAIDARAEQQRAEREPAEERRDHREHGRRLVAEPERACCVQTIW